MNQLEQLKSPAEIRDAAAKRAKAKADKEARAKAGGWYASKADKEAGGWNASNQSQAVIGDLCEVFAEWPHMLMPEERRPYFDKGEAEMVSARLTEKDHVPRQVNFRSLGVREVRNRFPLSILPHPTAPTDIVRRLDILPGADGVSHDVEAFVNREFYWIDRLEERDKARGRGHHAPTPV